MLRYMKSIFTEKLTLLIIIIAIFNLLSPRGNAYSPKSLNNLVLQCYKTRAKKDCINALTYLESIQIDAANRNAYRCQTYAIGIETDIVLVLLNPKKLETPRKNLSVLNQICRLY